MPPNTRLKLDPRDEYTHEPEPVPNYNESMYLNAFCSERRVGLWLRLGNRPHEGHAEMTVCVYLPAAAPGHGWRVGFMFGRPAISGNQEMAAAGLRFEVVEPLRRLRVQYEGELLVMDDPMAMADPSQAFKRYPKRPARITLEVEGVSPMHGGEIVTLEGRPVELDPEHAVYRGHTEQHLVVNGCVEVDGQVHEIRGGTGYRDKSWGPRHWHSFSWYKWLPVTFSRDFGVLLSIKPRGGRALPVSGNVLRGGVFEPVLEGHIETVYGEGYVPRSLVAHLRTAQGRYTLHGEVLATVPLRHRPRGQAEAGPAARYTRITENLVAYRCGEHAALGMAEYCDLMEDGRPLSLAEEAASP